jgi:Mg2+ and Co2+ transporter CorA
MTRVICTPPLSDNLIDRHQFYARVSCNLEEINIDIDGIGRKTTGMYEKLDSVNDVVKMYATRGNTIIACISVLWLLLGSGLTMYVNSVIEAANHTVASVNDLEKRMAMVEAANLANTPAIESIEKIKRNLANLQKEIDEKHQ